ncbi:integrase, partial [Sinorhizobium medicae]|nr:integrase [Sinorhizobium medicae]MDX0729215.1 integrase [Sinorhizobium medicae]MDX0735808.1 integrase [Sinorhizobium medicae]MDX0815706.1 integrase [Sinorhizobium medicae]
MQPIHWTEELIMTPLRQRMSEDMQVRNFSLNT